MAELSETEISNRKLAAGLLGIFLGSFGIHKFVLGYNNAGIIMLVVGLAGGVVTCGVATGVMSIIGLIEGVIYLTKSTDEFRELYLDQEKPWVLMSSSGFRRSVSTALLSGTALFSTAALVGHGSAGFHPLAWAAAVFPLQCAALVWAWQRRRD
jgi:TM2 domain-containing membrane protein YozV